MKKKHGFLLIVTAGILLVSCLFSCTNNAAKPSTATTAATTADPHMTSVPDTETVVETIASPQTDTVAATTAAPQTEPPVEQTIPTVYNDRPIEEGSYRLGDVEYSFKYSDGFFEVDPNLYQTHAATAACYLSYATSKGSSNGDYSECASLVTSVLSQFGFRDPYISPSFCVKPTSDSIGCVIAEKTVDTGRQKKRVISITVRSAGYEAEWVSNVTLGSDGEAAGFSSAATQVIDVYLSEFLSLHSELQTCLDRGEVAFWLQGYSRGGAVANLVAKRLIDRYQPSGNDVFAYCIEAPCAGVREMENPDRDYRSIHNVVNPNDPIPYLAPATMGFIRYGIDHYLFGGATDGDQLLTDASGNPVSDNKRIDKIDPSRLELIQKHLVQIFGSEENAQRYMPYTVEYKKLNLINLQIGDTHRNLSTAAFLETYLNELIYRESNDGNANRAIYADKGMQTALRRLIRFTYADADSDIFSKIGAMHLDQYVFEAAQNCRETLKKYVALNSRMKAVLSFYNPGAREVANEAVRLISEKQEFMEICADYPDGGGETALHDIGTVLYTLLYGTRDADDIITLASNIRYLSVNHEFVLQMAILRSYDSWFETTAEK